MDKFSTKKGYFWYQLVGISLLCISIIALVFNTTLAWFKDESITSNNVDIAIIGTLDLDVSTNFNFYNLSLAPDKIYTLDNKNSEIGTYIKTSNKHDINGAYVRVKFETTRKNLNTDTFIDNKDLFNLYFENNLTETNSYSSGVKNKWYFNSADGYYYYIGAIGSTNVCFNKGYKTSNLMTNVEKDAEVKIKFTVESIQRQYGAYKEEWATAPEIFKGWAVVDEEARWQGV